MKKFFLFLTAALFATSAWAIDYYTPSEEEVFYVVDQNAGTISTHGAIGSTSGTYTIISDAKTCCDPTDVSKTESVSKTLDLKGGNSAKKLVLNIANCDSITIYHNTYAGRGIVATMTPNGGSASNVFGTLGVNHTGFSLDAKKAYNIVLAGTSSTSSISGADVYVSAVRLIPSAGPFSVTYDANGGEGTMTDSNSPYTKNTTVTVLDNSFTAPTGQTFAGWNTKADGKGTSYSAGDTFEATKHVTLYAQWVYPEIGTGTISYTLTKGSAAVSSTITGVSTLSSSSTEFTTSTLSIGSSNQKDGYCGQITGHAADYSTSQKVALQFTIEDGYTFAPSAVSLTVFVNSSSAMKTKVVLSDGTTSIESNEVTGASSADTEITFAASAFTDKKLTGDVDVIIYQWGTTGKRTYIKSPVTITGTVAIQCTSPLELLSLSSDASSSVYVDDEINLSINGGNGAATSLKLDGEPFVGTTWTATAGEHTFTVSQAANKVNETTYCPGEDELVFNVLEKTPVSSVIIDGETTALVGKVLTYSATAENATYYEWYLDDVKQGSDSTKFIYSAVKGNHTIVCKARNAFNKDGDENPTWISSDELELAVTEPSGELIKATTQQVVTGAIGGTVTTSLSKGDTKKMDSGNHFGVTLAYNSFAEGDTLLINITSAADLGNCMIYGDKDGADLIYDEGTTYSSDHKSITGLMKIPLPAAAEGKQSLFLYRSGSTQWNITFSYIAVKRPEPEPTPSAVDNIDAYAKAVKVIRNGQLFIEKNGHLYNAMGIMVR